MRKPPDRTDKRVGSMIRMRRLTLELSQTTLANGAGIAYQQLQKAEI